MIFKKLGILVLWTKVASALIVLSMNGLKCLFSLSGELSKIRIEHDNAGWGAGWFLDHVEIVNQTTGQKYTFPCGQWLDKKKGDGEICRELYARE